MPGRATPSKAPRPIVKWAGGKTRLAERLAALMPDHMKTYVEPFCGGAAVFFHLAGEKKRRFEQAVLADTNPELVALYKAVKSDIDNLKSALEKYSKAHFALQDDFGAQRDHFYTVREKPTLDLTYAERGARFVFLNKTCFNGLWRVNAKGRFNVPFGKYANPKILDAEVLDAAHAALRDVTIEEKDFADATAKLVRGDFVYLDPPYVPVSGTANFTAYAKDGFRDADQDRLVAEVERLKRKHVKVMISNAWSEETKKLYAGMEKTKVSMPRSINSDPNKRGEVHEIVALNYKPASKTAARRSIAS